MEHGTDPEPRPEQDLVTAYSITRTWRNAITQRVGPVQRVFIACSTQALEIAEHLKTALEGEVEVVVWTDPGVFRLGRTTIENLDAASKRFDFGVFLFTSDDLRISKGEVARTPRDNVIFELGLFSGLSRSRAFIVMPKETEIALPTDLAGVTYAEYSLRRDGRGIDLGAVVSRLRMEFSHAMDC